MARGRSLLLGVRLMLYLTFCLLRVVIGVLSLYPGIGTRLIWMPVITSC